MSDRAGMPASYDTDLAREPEGACPDCGHGDLYPTECGNPGCDGWWCPECDWGCDQESRSGMGECAKAVTAALDALDEEG